MTQSFEEFLRKAISRLPIEYVNTECEQTYIDGKGDFAEDLGEWAWEQLKGEVNVSPLYTEILGLPISSRGLLLKEIAIACLGKAEVETRLRREGR